MHVSMRIAAAVWDKLESHHLAPGKRSESLSHIWAQAAKTKQNIVVLVPHTAPVYVYAPDCFLRQSGGNVRLAPEVLNGMLVRFAASPYNCLVNLHDHWFCDYPTFSGVDDEDDRRFDQYLRRSFEPMLKKHPHIGPERQIVNMAIVVGRKGIDARLVDTRRQPGLQTVGSVIVSGARLRRLATGQAVQRPKEVA